MPGNVADRGFPRKRFCNDVKISHLVDPLQLQDRCALKRSARGMLATPALSGILNKFSVEMYLFFSPKSPTAIVK